MACVGASPIFQIFVGMTIAILSMNQAGAQDNASWTCREIVLSNGFTGLICTKPTPSPPSSPELGPAPGLTKEDMEGIRRQFYTNIMNYIRPRTISRGRGQGEIVARVYAAAAKPKALAVCINWNTTTPKQLNLLGGSKFWFISAANICAPSNEAEAARCAISTCQRLVDCGSGRTCTVVDVNDRNALRFPKGWIDKYR
jgi:hypothetical protein